MIATHAAALKARLESDARLEVHNSARLDKEGRPIHDTYLIQWPGGLDRLDDERLAKAQAADSDAEFIVDFRQVATSAELCATNVDVALGLLSGHRLQVEGRRCDPMRVDEIGRVEWDTSVPPPLFFCDFAVILKSRRG